MSFPRELSSTTSSRPPVHPYLSESVWGTPQTYMVFTYQLLALYIHIYIWFYAFRQLLSQPACLTEVLMNGLSGYKLSSDATTQRSHASVPAKRPAQTTLNGCWSRTRPVSEVPVVYHTLRVGVSCQRLRNSYMRGCSNLFSCQ